MLIRSRGQLLLTLFQEFVFFLVQSMIIKKELDYFQIANRDIRLLNGATFNDVPIIIRKSHSGKSCSRDDRIIEQKSSLCVSRKRVTTHIVTSFVELFRKVFTEEYDI